MSRSVQIYYMFNESNSAVLAILVVEKSKFYMLGPNNGGVSSYKINVLFFSLQNMISAF